MKASCSSMAKAAVAFVLVWATASPASAAELTDDEQSVQGSYRLDDPYGTALKPGSGYQTPGALSSCEFIGASLEGGYSLRDQLGLSAPAQSSEMSDTRYGILVSAEEASLLDSAASARSAIDVRSLQDGLAERYDSYIGARWSLADMAIDLYFSTPPVGVLPLANSLGDLPENGVEVRVNDTEGALRESDFSDMGRLLPQWIESNSDLRPSYSIQGDVTCGRALLSVADSASGELVVSALSALGYDVADVGVVIDPAGSMVGVDTDRYHNHNPYRGGLVVESDTGSGRCTSSIPFHNGYGRLYAITAGHCVGPLSPDPKASYTDDSVFHQGGTELWQWPSTNISRYSSANFTNAGAIDAYVTELKTSYSGQSSTIYHGANHWAVTMDWWEWSRSLTMNGDTYCHSGLNWGNQICGTVINKAYHTSYWGITGTYSGWWDQILFDAPAYGGDSGGTMWNDKGSDDWYAGVEKGARNSNSETFGGHLEALLDRFPHLDAPVNMS